MRENIEKRLSLLLRAFFAMTTHSEAVQAILNAPSTDTAPDDMRASALLLTGKIMRLQKRSGVMLQEFKVPPAPVIIAYAVKARYLTVASNTYTVTDEGAHQWFKHAMFCENVTEDLDEHYFGLVADDLDLLSLQDHATVTQPGWREQCDRHTKTMTFIEAETATMQKIAGWCVAFPAAVAKLLPRDMMHRRDYPVVRNDRADADECKHVSIVPNMLTAYVQCESGAAFRAVRPTLFQAQDDLADVIWKQIERAMPDDALDEKKADATVESSGATPTHAPETLQKLEKFKTTLQTRGLLDLALDIYQMIEFDTTATLDTIKEDSWIEAPSVTDIAFVLAAFVEVELLVKDGDTYKCTRTSSLELSRVLQAI